MAVWPGTVTESIIVCLFVVLFVVLSNDNLCTPCKLPRTKYAACWSFQCHAVGGSQGCVSWVQGYKGYSIKKISCRLQSWKDCWLRGRRLSRWGWILATRGLALFYHVVPLHNKSLIRRNDHRRNICQCFPLIKRGHLVRWMPIWGWLMCLPWGKPVIAISAPIIRIHSNLSLH